MPAELGRTSRSKFGVTFTGIPELSRQLSRDGEAWKRVQQGAVKGMIENTEDLLGRSMRDAPIDEGTLRASGSAVVLANGKPVARRGFAKVAGQPEMPQMAERGGIMEGGLGDAVVGEVGFNTPYALVQHERLDFHHPRGGKAKYLEDNLKGQAGRYFEHLRGCIREALA